MPEERDHIDRLGHEYFRDDYMQERRPVLVRLPRRSSAPLRNIRPSVYRYYRDYTERPLCFLPTFLPRSGLVSIHRIFQDDDILHQDLSGHLYCREIVRTIVDKWQGLYHTRLHEDIPFRVIQVV